MHSNYSANSRNMQEHFTNKVTLVADGNILPTINEDVVMEQTQFLEDMESILEGTNNISMDFLEECLTKPRRARDLTALMSESDRKDLLQHQTPRVGLRRRLETYLEEELGRTCQEEATSEQAESKGNREETKETDKVEGKAATDENNTDHYETPIIWVIEPGYNKDGTLSFKFSTDGGACLILKDAEALESIEIMKVSSRNTYFQVFTIQGNISRIVKPDLISNIMEELFTDAKPNINEEDVVTADVESGHKVKYRPGSRLLRYILRRRWKKLVRRQVSIAVDDSRKGARVWMVLFPIFLVWKVLTRRSRAF